MNAAFSSPPGGGSSSAGGGDEGGPDPVSWLQIEQGWSVVGSDEGPVGTVLSVTGDKQDDIFDGLAISIGGSEPLRYVPGEDVGVIVPGKVTLRISAAEAGKLGTFVPGPAETVWRPGPLSLGARLSNWLRGKR